MFSKFSQALLSSSKSPSPQSLHTLAFKNLYNFSRIFRPGVGFSYQRARKSKVLHQGLGPYDTVSDITDSDITDTHIYTTDQIRRAAEEIDTAPQRFKDVVDLQRTGDYRFIKREYSPLELEKELVDPSGKLIVDEDLLAQQKVDRIRQQPEQYAHLYYHSTVSDLKTLENAKHRSHSDVKVKQEDEKEKETAQQEQKQAQKNESTFINDPEFGNITVKSQTDTPQTPRKPKRRF